MPREMMMALGVPGPSSVVEPGRRITLGAEFLGAEPFRPNRVIISDAESWSVESLTICGVEQLPNPVPAIVFADSPPLSLQIIAPGVEVELTLINTSTERRTASAALCGWGS